jgi:predicted nucleotidyltransferase
MLDLSKAEDGIRAFCANQPITRLALFGSALTDRFGPHSDVDLLVEFEPEAPVGFFEMAEMETQLGELLGRKVDLRTPQELSRNFRDRVVSAARPLYVRG